MMLDSASIQKRLDAGAEVHADGRTLQAGGGTPGGWTVTAPSSATAADTAAIRPAADRAHTIPALTGIPRPPVPPSCSQTCPCPATMTGPGTGDFRLG